MPQRLQQQLEQRQQQRLSPLQLRYASVLEMPLQRLEEEVRTALDENPVLELAEPEAVEEGAQLAPRPEPSRQWEGGGAYTPAGEMPESADLSEPTLSEHLKAQLAELDLEPDAQQLAEYIIDAIDSNGYLTRTAAQLALDAEQQMLREIRRSDVERLVEMIQRQFDPPGIAARGIRDNLRLQLMRLSGPEAEDALAIVGHDGAFEALAARHIPRIGAATGLSSDRVDSAIALIRSLNPRPGAQFGGGVSEQRTLTVVPDFIVMADPDDPTGTLTVTMPSRIPALALSQSAAGTGLSAGSEKALTPWRSEAEALIKALEMRRLTMMRVMRAIVQRQPDFFATGERSALKPLLLKDVASMIDADVSTVSRATAGKYVQTVHGIFPLRLFFNEAARGDTQAEGATSHAVMERLKRLVADEEKAHPLSDEALSAALMAEGFDVARRTVAKYRTLLGIPSSSRRSSR